MQLAMVRRVVAPSDGEHRQSKERKKWSPLKWSRGLFKGMAADGTATTCPSASLILGILYYVDNMRQPSSIGRIRHLSEHWLFTASFWTLMIYDILANYRSVISSVACKSFKITCRMWVLYNCHNCKGSTHAKNSIDIRHLQMILRSSFASCSITLCCRGSGSCGL